MTSQPIRAWAFRLASILRIPDPDVILDGMPARLFMEWIEFMTLDESQPHDSGSKHAAPKPRKVAQTPEDMYAMMRAAFPARG